MDHYETSGAATGGLERARSWMSYARTRITPVMGRARDYLANTTSSTTTTNGTEGTDHDDDGGTRETRCDCCNRVLAESELSTLKTCARCNGSICRRCFLLPKGVCELCKDSPGTGVILTSEQSGVSGSVRSHTAAFVRQRDAEVDKVNLEFFRLQKRIEKYQKLYTTPELAYVPAALFQEKEQQIVKWDEDESILSCPLCNRAFHRLSNRKHHCRLCGCVVCGYDTCSVKYPLFDSSSSSSSSSSASNAGTSDSAVSSLSSMSLNRSLSSSSTMEIRICTKCSGIISKHAKQPEEDQQPIHHYYQQMVKCKLAAEKARPTFETAFEQFDSARTMALKKERYEELTKQRLQLMQVYHLMDDISKKIAGLPISVKNPQYAKVHGNVRQSIRLYLQDQMLTLPPLPKESEWKMSFRENQAQTSKKSTTYATTTTTTTTSSTVGPNTNSSSSPSSSPSPSSWRTPRLSFTSTKKKNKRLSSEAHAGNDASSSSSPTFAVTETDGVSMRSLSIGSRPPAARPPPPIARTEYNYGYLANDDDDSETTTTSEDLLGKLSVLKQQHRQVAQYIEDFRRQGQLDVVESLQQSNVELELEISRLQQDVQRRSQYL